MISTPAIRNQIREGKTPQMESAILTSAKEGSVTMDNYLLKLVKEGMIEPNTAIEAANKPEYVSQNVRGGGAGMGLGGGMSGGMKKGMGMGMQQPGTGFIRR